MSNGNASDQVGMEFLESVPRRLVVVYLPLLVFLFVLLYGMGNGMQTIVKGTAIAQYVNRDHVASLNGALGIPQALARAAAPLALGLLWSREAGYSYGLWLMLGLSGIAIVSLVLAQRIALEGAGTRTG